ncbi:MYLK2 kinase, partial [Aegotheles bennettii]|nr:MYLK2 kinase [Aegotheles bennettii]
MEQGGGAGGSGSTALPGAEGSTALAAPTEGTVTAAAMVHDGGKDGAGQEKAPAAATAQDGGRAEPGKVEPVGMMALTTPEPRDGGKAVPVKEVSTAQHDGGGQAAPAEGKVPAAAGARDGGKGGKNGPGKDEKNGPGKEKAPAVGKPKAGKAEPIMEKCPAAAKALDEGKDQTVKEQTPGGTETEGSGKTEPRKEKAPAAAEAKGGKVKPTKETALAEAQAQDGGKEEPTKEKTTAAAKAQDGGKAETKAEKTPAVKKPPSGSKEEPAKEKVPAAAKVQDGGKAAPKVEKPTAASKAQGGGKEEPTKGKTTGSEKEKVPAPAKAQDGGKAEAKAEKATVASKAQDGVKEELRKEKIMAPEKKVPVAAQAQDGGKAEAKAEKTPADKKPPGVPLGGRRARGLLTGLCSPPAPASREEQPRAEVLAMEMIPEEPTAAETREGPAAPGPAPQPPAPAGTAPQRTVPCAAGQPPHPPGAAEQPGPGAEPSSGPAEPPPSPYLTPDFGKEDPFEILGKARGARLVLAPRDPPCGSTLGSPPAPPAHALGSGKFGEVHTCTEKQTGLKLAAKVIRKQGAKDKEMVLLEIDVMNQLNHRNLIQLYDAIETPREIILFMEFVEGGELFERIIDDDYHLTEVDCMVFVRQICEGIRFMHHMHVLHLDLKPENILCVTATGHMVKIIDFGLARRYNPQEKLKVNFGTPEFLSPEVVNYEQVSYSTDMWSMGVITYMLLSGLSPFLGDNDTETLNNVLAASWYFDEETFESVSEEAKDFVSNLIIKEKSARMSAGQCLQHPWLNNLAEKAKRCNRRLKSQVLLKKYVMRRRWKKNFIGVCAANRFRKITSSGSLTALGV